MYSMYVCICIYVYVCMYSMYIMCFRLIFLYLHYNSKMYSCMYSMYSVCNAFRVG